jgi:vacuolar-type H+-ATPase subunit H
MSSEAMPATGDPLESIKRVTSAETEVETKVTGLRESVKSQLDALQRETETVLLQARTDAEREREATLAAARADGERDAEKILTEGSQRASAIHGKSPAELARQRDAILSAVLAEFRPAEKNSRN